MIAHHIAIQTGLRRRLYRELEPSARDKAGLSRANSFITALVLISFVVFAIESEPTITGAARAWVAGINLAILFAFLLEYVVRLWVAGENTRYKGFVGRVRYALSPFALTDIAAFLPELFWLLLTPTGPADRMLMFLRVLRLIRLVKIARFVPAFEVLGAAMRRAGGQLLTALALALVLVYLSAVLLYFIEGIGQGHDEFASIPRAIWWAIAALTTVGYGDVYPVTVLGRIAGSVIALAGIGVVALPAGIFASAFSDELREREQRRLSKGSTDARPEVPD